MFDQKYNTNNGDKHFKNMHLMNLTFGMLVNIHFQKYKRGDQEPRQKTSAVEI